VQFGDEPTKFFHVVATERYRLNAIKSIQDEEGRDLSEHEEKAAVLWNTYRSRMCESTNPKVMFQLQHIISSQVDLSHLVEPFTNDEIDKCIKEMPSERAPVLMGLACNSSRNVGMLLNLTFISYVMISSMSKLACRPSTTLLLH
jgi:hypothetical protein